MRVNMNQSSSSRVSPPDEIWIRHLDMSEMYTYMLLDDFCREYSIDLSPDWDSHQFYAVESDSDSLINMLTFQKPWDLNRILRELFSQITGVLIEYGKVFLEIVDWKDENGNLTGISFELLKPLASFPIVKKTKFVSITYDKKIHMYSINAEKLIVFDLRDLGYSRRLFTAILKRINRREITRITDFSLEENLEFSFQKYVSNAEYQLLKNTKKIYWYGRNSRNQYMSSVYLVWREAKFLELKKKFLDYILDKINEKIKLYADHAEFAGTITADCKSADYSRDFQKLQRGEISLKQFSDKLYERRRD